MKIAFTTSGINLEALLDLRFGRASGFLLYDLDRETFEMVENEKALQASQGSGLRAAETVARSGASGVVTGHCGPKAFRVLSAAAVAVYKTDVSTVKEALAAFRAGALTPVQSADVASHWK